MQCPQAQDMSNPQLLLHEPALPPLVVVTPKGTLDSPQPTFRLRPGPVNTKAMPTSCPEALACHPPVPHFSYVGGPVAHGQYPARDRTPACECPLGQLLASCLFLLRERVLVASQDCCAN